MPADYRAAFIRGGTSKALVFHERDLPEAREERDAIFLRAMGSPDPYGRQLDGMGGGLSSLSKVCVVGPPSRPDADVDYLFAQVQVDTPAVDYTGNCGNMSSAIGPFAVDEGLVPAVAGEASVRVHNVNTGKIIRAAFEVRDGRSVTEGDYRLQGVAGTGAPVRLDFLEPGGAATGALLPAGQVTTRLTVAASLVDASNPVVFLDAADLGLTATELPEALDGDAETAERVESLRREGSVRMGLAGDERAAGERRMTPFVAVVAPPAAYRTLSGEEVPENEIDLLVRFWSNGKAHRALPLTGALCTAIAARLPGSVVHRQVRDHRAGGSLRLGSPSGPLEVDASVVADSSAPEGFRAQYATAYRTTRRLFTGFVHV
ncbi:2-methylaconitate cis-trans isomerase PrpF family protein [Amycolatopsis sp.]|uniref:2-methylaconitate cis-trans isomerase PrpF family protein n=1 Tax=Amycolatopsis sp. TaxID=37632 RepID=UPI002CB18AF4|nr:PrpF domain-containing protein [Amycolatopsis sp.]HVV09284.1 PrpF domain-containing protein [Amycolatopsis sp.]